MGGEIPKERERREEKERSGGEFHHPKIMSKEKEMERKKTKTA